MRLALALLFGCRAAAAAPLTGTVAVWIDAPLVFDPAKPDQTVPLEHLRYPRGGRPSVVVPLRIIADRGELLEVTPARGRCGLEMTVPDADQVRFFVRRSDLATVITKPFQATFTNGTSIALDPGTHVERVGDHYLANLGTKLPVALPETSVGLAYTPLAPRPVFTPKPGTTVQSTYDIAGVLGSRSFAGHFHAIVAAPVSSGTLFTLDARCGRAVLAVDRVSSWPQAYQPPDLLSREPPLGPTIPRGTAVFAGAHRVGRLIRPLPITTGRCGNLRLSYHQLDGEEQGIEHVTVCAR